MISPYHGHKHQEDAWTQQSNKNIGNSRVSKAETIGTSLDVNSRKIACAAGVLAIASSSSKTEAINSSDAAIIRRTATMRTSVTAEMPGQQQ